MIPIKQRTLLIGNSKEENIICDWCHEKVRTQGVTISAQRDGTLRFECAIHGMSDDEVNGTEDCLHCKEKFLVKESPVKYFCSKEHYNCFNYGDDKKHLCKICKGESK